ncbi:KTSC domain-containing protein [Bradyrhizobium vignae]|uniref:KTSC domain-containing protein n=1 Tax=Bradyrhizobium vignae TaxID=1549949 RepID=UPI001ABFEB79
MMRTPVRSSTLVSVGYDEAQQLLESELRNNPVYQYFRDSKVGLQAADGRLVE